MPIARAGLLLIPGFFLLCACASQPSGAGGGQLPRGQQFELEYVSQQAPKLRLGMSQGEVQRLLGTPARIDNDRSTWTYLPNRRSTLQLEKKLVLKFIDDTYVDHKYMTTYELDYSYPQK